MASVVLYIPPEAITIVGAVLFFGGLLLMVYILIRWYVWTFLMRLLGRLRL